MNQYDLNHLFDQLDKALGTGRSIQDPKRLRANQFMLLRIDSNGVCHFKHKPTGLCVKFNWKAKSLVE